MSGLGRRVGMDEDDKDGVVAKKTKKRKLRKWGKGNKSIYIFFHILVRKKFHPTIKQSAFSV